MLTKTSVSVTFFPKSGKWLLYFKKLMALIFMISGIWFFSIYINNNHNNVFTFNNISQIPWKTWNLKKDPYHITALRNRGKSKEILGDLASACSDWLKASNLGDIYVRYWIKKKC